MNCQDARASIPAYLDGELVEERAGPLRRHLLDCQPCRGSAQSEKNLKRWFAKAKESAPAIPRDFSARVARRAFAGDPGERFSEPRTIEMAGYAVAGSVTVGSGRDERNLGFVLALTAAAAVLLVTLSFAIRGLSLPSGSSMLAEPTMSIQEANQRLERLNLPSPATVQPNGAADSKGTETKK
ncbi:MAG: zf-HC2 domain-containing protein [Planctomycetes bacterium]|nr:zf-HC2 domain-containing protein [Planctomycetota bacterium]